jgi:hypothetical protein
MLTRNSRGNYSFVRGIGPFSAAVMAQPGFEIVHASFAPLIPLGDGYSRVEQHLRDFKRPLDTLCGMELRIPQALSREAFDEFNRPYIERLKAWGLEVDGANPVTRTNVALEIHPVSEPMLAGFYYTVPSSVPTSTFVLSGAPEIASRAGGVQIVARGDVSIDGLRQKLECILQVLGAHLCEMGLRWESATGTNLYTVHDVHPLLETTLLPALGNASRMGLTWHHARPPVSGLEVEVDARAVKADLILA